MILVFVLVVLINSDEQVSDDRMIFRDVLRCNFFAHAIESGRYREYGRPSLRDVNVTAYCLPKMVEEGTPTYD